VIHSRFLDFQGGFDDTLVSVYLDQFPQILDERITTDLDTGIAKRFYLPLALETSLLKIDIASTHTVIDLSEETGKYVVVNVDVDDQVVIASFQKAPRYSDGKVHAIVSLRDGFKDNLMSVSFSGVEVISEQSVSTAPSHGIAYSKMFLVAEGVGKLIATLDGSIVLSESVTITTDIYIAISRTSDNKLRVVTNSEPSVYD